MHAQVGTVLHTATFFRAMLAPFEKLGIFYNSVFKMLYSDVSIWLVLFSIILLNYGFAMFICYPFFDGVTQPLGAPEPVTSFSKGLFPAPAVCRIPVLN